MVVWGGPFIVPEPVQTSFSGLVLFLICLAIVGSILAGVVYFTMILPAQEPENAPPNGPDNGGPCEIFRTDCPGGCGNDQACRDRCDQLYNGCEYKG